MNSSFRPKYTFPTKKSKITVKIVMWSPCTAGRLATLDYLAEVRCVCLVHEARTREKKSHGGLNFSKVQLNGFQDMFFLFWMCVRILAAGIHSVYQHFIGYHVHKTMSMAWCSQLKRYACMHVLRNQLYTWWSRQELRRKFSNFLWSRQQACAHHSLEDPRQRSHAQEPRAHCICSTKQA